ncbi:MAG: DoxX family protein [Paramuribaculum sp.]|nr:DoxX family protein [Paramuribaculum sp.]
MNPETRSRLIVAFVWILRISIGVVFIASGLAKTIDLWGTVYKIEEYLKVWHMWQPRSLVFMASFLLAGIEFVLGSLLLIGAYRRASVWLLLLMMCGMLPLTLYIYVSNPVSDCGCFGDMLLLSNAATFWKNVVISAGLIFLCCFNRRVAPLFSPWIQWLVTALLIAYTMIVGLYGYNIQPMVDFRSFPAGSAILSSDDNISRARFIYVKDGKKREFDMDNLPGEEWTYVGRVEDSDKKLPTEMAVFDSYGEDVTADVIPLEGHAIILVVPEISRAEVSYTYFLNELNERITADGGSMLAIVSGADTEIEMWRDLAMAEYPVYSAESTLLKELSRGNMSIVSLSNGIIDWKQNLSTVDSDTFLKEYQPSDPESVAPFDGPATLRYLSLLLAVILGVLYMLDSTGRLLRWKINHGFKSRF